MVIKIENVSKKFKETEVLKNINLQFKENNIYGIYGRNGSGKSVLLKIICGFYVPSNGKVLFNGVDLNSKLEFPPNLRALIEKPSFYPDLSGYENLKILASIQDKIGDLEINKALEIVNLSNQKDKKYSKYSLGMKQKLGIAQVIMEDPQIMIFDEPFNGIEAETVEKLINYLKKEKNKGKIIIISTHIIEDLNKLTNNIIRIDNGKIINND